MPNSVAMVDWCGPSQAASGRSGLMARGLRLIDGPMLRGRPAMVISATEHFPARMAAAAWATWAMYEHPPSSVPSIQLSRRLR
ncbi:hypothetical protein D3C78_1742410 [compost metagenome]